MSKKSRRQRRVNLPPEAFNTPIAVAPSTSMTGGNVAATSATRKSGEVNWQSEYGAVMGDLKRTGILAAIMMTAMVLLSFVIR